MKSISSRLTSYHRLGNGEDKKASLLGFAFAALTSLIGMAGIKRKKEDK